MSITPQLLIPIAFAIIPGIYLQFSEVINPGDLIVGTATAFLAVATFWLVKTEIGASRKERTRDRLKERLEGLYSPLMGLGDSFDINTNHSVFLTNPIGSERSQQHSASDQVPVRSTMASIRNVYSYLASDALKTQLDYYYKNYYVVPHMPNSDTLKSIRVQFTTDFEEITTEYRDLTLSETEKKRIAEIEKASSETPLPK